MTETVGTTAGASWPVASRKRRVLAGYLDYLLLGGPWAVAMWFLADSLPPLQRASFPLKLVIFFLLEVVALKLLMWSPGQYCLGIVAFRRSPFAAPQDSSAAKASYGVDPHLFFHERWWTMLFGVLAVLSGTKDLVRWTMWHVPLPVMGVQLTEQASIRLQVLVGAAEIFIGVAALRLNPLVLPVGLAVYGFQVVSTVLSWPLLPGWVETYVRERRSYQGLTPRPGEAEFMQAVVPIGMVVLGVVAALWSVFVGRRARQAGVPDLVLGPAGGQPAERSRGG